MLRKKAQSSLEYIIVLAAIIACIIYGAAKFISPAVYKNEGGTESGMYYDLKRAVENVSDRIAP